MNILEFHHPLELLLSVSNTFQQHNVICILKACFSQDYLNEFSKNNMGSQKQMRQFVALDLLIVLYSTHIVPLELEGVKLPL